MAHMIEGQQSYWATPFWTLIAWPDRLIEYEKPEYISCTSKNIIGNDHSTTKNSNNSNIHSNNRKMQIILAIPIIGDSRKSIKKS